MENGAFPKTSEEFTVDWLADKLRTAGLIDTASLAGFTFKPIGTGQVGDSIRFALTYDQPDAGPPSLVAKFAAADPTSRGTAVMMSLYRHEIGFFRAFAADLPVRTPGVVFADIADDGGDFVLLMEDMAPARQGDQLASCSIEDARAAIKQAAALHGPTWGKARFVKADFIAPDPQVLAMATALFPSSTAAFIGRYADDLSADDLAVINQLGERAAALFNMENPYKCLVHGDFRLDNLMFDIGGGAEPIAVVDWQTLTPGDGATDIGYFLGAGIGAELRRAHEVELIDLYRAEMARHGVSLSRADIDHGYRRGAIQGLSTAVFSAANVVSTERGDANFLSMARGALDLIHDSDALAILKET